ncbi:outer membrane lipoprotein carrier protein LolA [bacterium]|nr:outer membrane lipoprotein carrier protein LolA [bacterium]
MKRFFILTLFVLTAFGAESEVKIEEAKTPPAEIKLKPAAPEAKGETAEANSKIDKALEELGAKIKDLKTFTADFTQLDIDPLFMDESTHKGKLSFLRAVMDGKTNCFLRFDYEEPEKSVTILTPLGIVIYTDDMTEPQISPARDGNSADIIFSTFVSPAALKRHYEVHPGKSQKTYSFKLIPKSSFAKSFFSEAEVDFSEKTGLPERLRQIKINGQDITLSFSNAHLNAQLPVDNFDAASLKKKP